MTISLKQRLLVMLLSTICIFWLGITVISYYDSINHIEELSDAHLAQFAKVILSLVDEELYEEHSEVYEGLAHDYTDRIKEVEDHLQVHKYEKILAFQFTVGDNEFNFSSAMAPDEPLSGDLPGFSTTTINGEKWRVYTLKDPENIITIRTGEPYSLRSDLACKIAIDLILPFLVALPILAILIRLSISRSLSPLQNLTDSIQTRDSTRLDPIDHKNIPEEVTPLTNALNNLFSRLKTAMDNEREFTSNAAHELRTPLAGLRAQAQVALSTTDTNKQNSALQQLIKGVDRMTHLVEQLLTLARLEPDNESPHKTELDLGKVIQEVISDTTKPAHEKNIRINFEADDTDLVYANEHTIMTLVRNLLTNAIRFSPDDSQINVKLEQASSCITMSIIDNGPGIPEEAMNDVFKRFYRGKDVKEPGCGLGLSIVKRIADLHHAEIKLINIPGGFQVDIIFPVNPTHTIAN